jgi:hypothetical protein
MPPTGAACYAQVLALPRPRRPGPRRRRRWHRLKAATCPRVAASSAMMQMTAQPSPMISGTRSNRDRGLLC